LRVASTVFVLTAVFAAAPALSQADWMAYENARFGYAALLPVAGFTMSETDNGLTLLEEGGRGQIDLYGATNPERLGPLQYQRVLADADRISTITYSRRGNSWLVVSGYYKADPQRGDNLIFYAKFMFSPDRGSIAAFEASYPVEERDKFDPIIERLEDHLTGPK
jgi:hypothetical protein